MMLWLCRLRNVLFWRMWMSWLISWEIQSLSWVRKPLNTVRLKLNINLLLEILRTTGLFSLLTCTIPVRGTYMYDGMCQWHLEADICYTHSLEVTMGYTWRQWIQLCISVCLPAYLCLSVSRIQHPYLYLCTVLCGAICKTYVLCLIITNEKVKINIFQ